MEQAFLKLISNYRGVILKVCRIYEDNPENRRDLFQEIILQLWRTYPTFKGKSSPSTWVYRVALNTAITLFRKKKRKPETVLIENQPIPETYFDRSDEKPNKSRILFQAIDRLNKVEKGIIILYLDDKSYREMAEITGYSLSNIGVKLNRIKQKLSEIIKNIES